MMCAPRPAASRILETALLRFVAVFVEHDIWTRATVNLEEEGLIKVAPQLDPLSSEHHLTKFFFEARWKFHRGIKWLESVFENDPRNTVAKLC
jgi:hypothetical protein